jgi:hypothetical protein
MTVKLLPQAIVNIAESIAYHLGLDINSNVSIICFILRYVIANSDDIADLWNEDHTDE